MTHPLQGHHNKAHIPPETVFGFFNNAGKKETNNIKSTWPCYPMRSYPSAGSHFGSHFVGLRYFTSVMPNTRIKSRLWDSIIFGLQVFCDTNLLVLIMHNTCIEGLNQCKARTQMGSCSRSIVVIWVKSFQTEKSNRNTTSLAN